MRTTVAVRLAGAAMLLALAACGTAPEQTSPVPTASPALPPAPAGDAVAPTSSPSATAAPAATSAPSATAAPTLAALTYQADALQTIADYYRAINARDYRAAYALWGGDGRASGQSLDAFQQGFAETRRVELLLEEPRNQDVGAGQLAIEVPVTILAATDTATERFSGVYSLTASNGAGAPYAGWRIAGAQISAAPAPDGDEAPEAVVQRYYDAINQHRYAAAYSLWRDVSAASGQSYEAFAQGFADTASVALTLGEVTQDAGAGSRYAEAPVTIVAQAGDGATRTFCGTYQLVKPNIVGAGAMPWRIGQASIRDGDGCR